MSPDGALPAGAPRPVRVALWVLASLGLGLALLGGIGSFTTVRDLAEPWSGSRAWIVPIGIDIGILTLLGWDLLLEYLGLAWPVLRWIGWTFITATVGLNIAAAAGHPVPTVMHAAMPILFVITLEGARHLIRHGLGLAAAARIEAIPRSRWLLAPISTLLLWRRMVLWHVPRYREGLRLEHHHLLDVARLQRQYGRWRWHWRAPLHERLAHRLHTVTSALASTAPTVPELTRENPQTGLLTAARAVGDEAERGNFRLTQKHLAQRLREQGYSVANGRLRTLMAELARERIPG